MRAVVLLSLVLCPLACVPEPTPGDRFVPPDRPDAAATDAREGLRLEPPEPGWSARVVLGESARFVVWQGTPDLAIDRIDADGSQVRVLDVPRDTYGGVAAIALGRGATARLAIAWFVANHAVELLVIDGDGATVHGPHVVAEDAFTADDPILVEDGDGAALAFLTSELETRTIEILRLDADGNVSGRASLAAPGTSDVRLALSSAAEPVTLTWGHDHVGLELAGEGIGTIAPPSPWDGRVFHAPPPSHAEDKAIALVWTSSLRIAMAGVTSGVTTWDVPSRDVAGREESYFPQAPWDAIVTRRDHAVVAVVLWARPYHWPEAHGCALPAPDRMHIFAQIEYVDRRPGTTLLVQDWTTEDGEGETPTRGTLVTDAHGRLHAVLHAWRRTTIVPVSLE